MHRLHFRLSIAQLFCVGLAMLPLPGCFSIQRLDGSLPGSIEELIDALNSGDGTPESGQAVPPLVVEGNGPGQPVNDAAVILLRLVNRSSQSTDVSVTFSYRDVLVHASFVRLGSGGGVREIGPDLVGVIAVSGTFADGSPIPQRTYRFGIEYDADGTIEYFLDDPPEFDCNENGIEDAVDIADCDGSPACGDCNANGVPDACDISTGLVDVDADGIPDTCQPVITDCNGNGTDDAADIANCVSDPACGDCNDDGVPDGCELSGNDCDASGVPDDCELADRDCNENGTLDSCDIASGASDDVDDDGVPDECALIDCNQNGTGDAIDIANCPAGNNACRDCNADAIPDGCELTGNDCNSNGIPDDCELSGNDCNGNRVPDGCELANNDCNKNGTVDSCEIAGGNNDANGNGVPDDCEFADCNHNGVNDATDIATCDNDPACDDCNDNGVLDECDIANCDDDPACFDANENGVPDGCESPSLILFVDDDAAPGGDGQSWQTAFSTLQDALTASGDSGGSIEQIWVATGTYKPDQGGTSMAGDQSATFQLQNGVTVWGGFAGDEDPIGFDLDSRDFVSHETILSGDLLDDDGSDCCFPHSGGACEEKGCTIAVCEIMPSCCGGTWDAVCAGLAGTECGSLCGLGDRSNNTHHVVTGSGTNDTAILDGFTIAGGDTFFSAPLFCGAGMLNDNGSPTVRRCRFEGNRAIEGGGMCNLNGANPIVDRCQFEGNEAFNECGVGGAMYNENSLPTVTFTKFWGNVSDTAGGAVEIREVGASGTLATGSTDRAHRSRAGSPRPMPSGPGIQMFVHCDFRGNRALGRFGCSGDGGAIRNLGTGVSIINSLFVGNEAERSGGAIFSNTDGLGMVNSTIVSNVANGSGGGISLAPGSNGGLISNTILWGNLDSGGDSSAEESQIGFTGTPPVVVFSDIAGLQFFSTSPGNIDADPLFVDRLGNDGVAGTRDDDLRLMAGSPCIDAGENDSISIHTVVDLDEFPRFVDDPATLDTGESGDAGPPVVDMGAYEFQPTGQCVVDSECNDGLDCTSDTCQSGFCVNITNDAACDDGLFCNGIETCDGSDGCLAGTPPCSANVCDEALDACPTMIFVDAATDGANDGSSWVDAFASLQSALDSAGDATPATVWVAGGLYRPTIPNGSRNERFVLRSGVAVYGGFAGNEDPVTFDLADRDLVANASVLSGDLNGNDVGGLTDPSRNENSFHVVQVAIGADATAVFDGFRVESGQANGLFGSGDDRGGGIDNSAAGAPSLANLSVENCFATFGAGFNNGAGFATVNDSTFSHNQAISNGGGVLNAGGQSTYTNCIFDDNGAINGGGAFDSGANTQVTYDGCRFTGNVGDGAGLSSQLANLMLSNCMFVGNMGSLVGGGMSADRGTLSLRNCSFTSNSAVRQGGGIYISGAAIDMNLDNCTFTGNTAASAGNGGGMYLDGASPTLTNSRFDDNTAEFEGGGIYNAGGSPMMTACVFDGNEALNSDSGGGMANNGGSPMLVDCTFSNNSATNGLGGGIYNNNSSPTLVVCSFTGNRAETDGGGMFNFQSTVTLDSCKFSENMARIGGGIRNNESTVNAMRCDFDRNVVTDSGGGIYNEASSMSLGSCRFTGNTATSAAGGLFNTDSGDVTIVNSIFSSNLAVGGAGAVVNGIQCTLTMTNCTLTENEAIDGGANDSGGILNLDSLLVVTNSVLFQNRVAGVADERAQISVVTGQLLPNYNLIQGLDTIAQLGVGNIDGDPLFGDPDGRDDVPGTLDDDVRLLAGSPCIDAANNDADIDAVMAGTQPIPGSDLDGNPRQIDDPSTDDTGQGNPPIVDMGAYEVRP